MGKNFLVIIIGLCCNLCAHSANVRFYDGIVGTYSADIDALNTSQEFKQHSPKKARIEIKNIGNKNKFLFIAIYLLNDYNDEIWDISDERDCPDSKALPVEHLRQIFLSKNKQDNNGKRIAFKMCSGEGYKCMSIDYQLSPTEKVHGTYQLTLEEQKLIAIKIEDFNYENGALVRLVTLKNISPWD